MLIAYLFRFHQKCPKGDMDANAFKELFKVPFPIADLELVAEIVYEVYDEEKTGNLDFKVRE